MNTWNEYFKIWNDARFKKGEEAHLCIQEARKRVARNSKNDWVWLKESLSNSERKWFVAEVYKFQTVPKKLFYAMLYAGILEKDPSANRVFIEPCVRSYGAYKVIERLFRYLESGSNPEKAGAVSALYWVKSNPKDENLNELKISFHSRMLNEFIENPDLEVRRRIIPMLRLEPESYPAEIRARIPVAIKIARNHHDEYIRHRVEIQLGANGPFMAIPDTR